MYIAKDKDGNDIEAYTLKKDVYCPICHEPLILKHGKINATHYAHYPSSECITTTDNRYSEKQGYIISQFKKLLYNNKYIGEIETYKKVGTRYADITFKLHNNNKVNVNVIIPEVSSTTNVIERMEYFQEEDYYNLNIFVDDSWESIKPSKGAILTHKLSFGNCVSYSNYLDKFINNHFEAIPQRITMKHIKRMFLPKTWKPFISTADNTIESKFDPRGTFWKLHGKTFKVAWIQTGKQWWNKFGGV